MVTRKPELPTVDDPHGRNRDAVAALLDSLPLPSGCSYVCEHQALGQLALTLAETLDNGAGMATAAVSRELRATLATLTAMTPKGDEDDDIFGNDVPATIRDTEES